MTGRVISISGVEEAGAVPGVKAAKVQCSSGQELKELENGTGRIGYDWKNLADMWWKSFRMPIGKN